MSQSIYIINYFESMQWGDDMGVDSRCFSTLEAAKTQAQQDECVKSGEWLYTIQELILS